MLRYPIVLAILCTLASCGSSSAASPAADSSSAAPGANCGPGKASTLAHSRQARVYVRRGVVFGCTGASRPELRLGRSGLCLGSSAVGALAVSGQLVAYALRSCGVDTSRTLVIVRRLSDGATLSSQSATSTATGVESFQSVGSIAVTGSGAVAWIGLSSSIASGRSVIQVLERSGGSIRMLDHGSSIVPSSLRLGGAKLTWQYGESRRSARLG